MSTQAPNPEQIKENMENSLATTLATVFDRNKQDFKKGIHSLKNILDSSTTDNETINELQQKLNECTTAKNAIETQNKELDANVKQLETSYNALKTQYDINENRNAEILDENSNMKQQLLGKEVLNENIAKLQKELTQLKTEKETVITLKLDILRLQGENQKLNENNALQKDEMNSLRLLNNTLNQQNKKLQNENNTQKNKLDNVLEKNKTQENALKELQKNQNITVVDNLSELDDNRQSEIENLKTELSKLQSELEACRNTNADLSKTNTEMGPMQTTVNSLLKHLTEFHVSIAPEEENTLNPYLGEDGKLKISDNKSLKLLVDALTEKNTIVFNNYKTQGSVNEEALKQIASLQSTNDTLRGENKTLKTDNTNLQTALDACNDDKKGKTSETQQKIQELSDLNQKLSTEISELKTTHTAEIKTLNDAKTKLEKDLETCDQAKTELKNQIKSQTDELTTLTQLLDSNNPPDTTTTEGQSISPDILQKIKTGINDFIKTKLELSKCIEEKESVETDLKNCEIRLESLEGLLNNPELAKRFSYIKEELGKLNSNTKQNKKDTQKITGGGGNADYANQMYNTLSEESFTDQNQPKHVETVLKTIIDNYLEAINKYAEVINPNIKDQKQVDLEIGNVNTENITAPFKFLPKISDAIITITPNGNPIDQELYTKNAGEIKNYIEGLKTLEEQLSNKAKKISDKRKTEINNKYKKFYGGVADDIKKSVIGISDSGFNYFLEENESDAPKNEYVIKQKHGNTDEVVITFYVTVDDENKITEIRYSLPNGGDPPVKTKFTKIEDFITKYSEDGQKAFNAEYKTDTEFRDFLQSIIKKGLELKDIELELEEETKKEEEKEKSETKGEEKSDKLHLPGGIPKNMVDLSDLFDSLQKNLPTIIGVSEDKSVTQDQVSSVTEPPGNMVDLSGLFDSLQKNLPIIKEVAKTPDTEFKVDTTELSEKINKNLPSVAADKSSVTEPPGNMVDLSGLFDSLQKNLPTVVMKPSDSVTTPTTTTQGNMVELSGLFDSLQNNLPNVVMKPSAIVTTPTTTTQGNMVELSGLFDSLQNNLPNVVMKPSAIVTTPTTTTPGAIQGPKVDLFNLLDSLQNNLPNVSTVTTPTTTTPSAIQGPKVDLSNLLNSVQSNLPSVSTVTTPTTTTPGAIQGPKVDLSNLLNSLQKNLPSVSTVTTPTTTTPSAIQGPKVDLSNLFDSLQNNLPSVSTVTTPADITPSAIQGPKVDLSNLLNSLQKNLPIVVSTTVTTPSALTPIISTTPPDTKTTPYPGVIVEESDTQATIIDGPFVYDLIKGDPDYKITQSYYDGTKYPLITFIMQGNELEYIKANDKSTKTQEFKYENINSIYTDPPNLASEIQNKFKDKYKNEVYFQNFIGDIYMQYILKTTYKELEERESRLHESMIRDDEKNDNIIASLKKKLNL